MNNRFHDIITLIEKRGLTALTTAAIFLLGIGFVAGWFSGARWGFLENNPSKISELRLGGYDLINPLLECDQTRDAELTPFKHKISSYSDENKKNGLVTQVSVYFREMNNGLMFSIDATDKFSPASLIKVPLLMAYLKIAETDPRLLAQKILCTNRSDLNAPQVIKPRQAIEYGKSYTVEELLRYAIVYSDNNAYFLLFSRINPKQLQRTYTELGLEIPKVRNRDDYMSVTEYSAFFRILFNASYLNKDMSEKAMHYLAAVDFKEGLVAGVPAGITVAHKFGERTMGEHNEIKQLHDCGIVYYPKHPYLLCVMSRGASIEYLDDTIREISRITFNEIDAQNHDH